MQRDTPLLRGLRPAVPTQVVLTTLSTLIHSLSLTTMEVNLHCHSRITSRWTHKVSCFVKTSKTTQKCLRSKIPKAARLDCWGVAVRIVCVCRVKMCVSYPLYGHFGNPGIRILFTSFCTGYICCDAITLNDNTFSLKNGSWIWRAIYFSTMQATKAISGALPHRSLV